MFHVERVWARFPGPNTLFVIRRARRLLGWDRRFSDARQFAKVFTAQVGRLLLTGEVGK
jgi:hypothetical protein